MNYVIYLRIKRNKGLLNIYICIVIKFSNNLNDKIDINFKENYKTVL